MRLLALCGIVLYLCVSCSAVGGQVYTLTPEQLDAMRKIANITPCVTGHINIAGIVETEAGGGLLTVKCDVIKGVLP